MRVTVRQAVLFALFIFLKTFFANAQTLAGVEQGIKPYGSYEGGNIDSISMVNGSLTLNIPLISYPQRGGRLQVGFRLVYNNPWLYPWAANCSPTTHGCLNKGYNLVYFADPSNSGFGNLNGETFGTALGIADDLSRAVNVVYLNSQCCPQPIKYYTVTEPDGAMHELGPVSGTNQWRSVDATGYVFVNTSSQYNYLGVLQDRLGNQQDTSITNGVFSVTYEDVNGNLISTTDTMGRTIPSASGTSTTDLSHCPASATTASIWSPPGPNGGTSTYKFCYADVNISFTAPDCAAGCNSTSTTAKEMVGIVLPNLTAWTFAYDTLGDLTNISFPTGGSISYNWATTYGPCVGPQYVEPLSGVNTQLWPYRLAVTSRTLNANDGTGPHTWNYALSSYLIDGHTLQTVATDPLLNDTVHTVSSLGGCSLYETQTDRYSGSHTATGNNPLQTVAMAYNYSSGGGAQYGYGNIVINVVPKTVTTTDVLSGKVSQITKTYDSGVPDGNPIGGNIILGDLLTESHYDYGNGTPGSLLQQTINQYMALSSPNSTYYLGGNLLDLPYTVQVKDGSGTQMSLTQYNYDEGSRASSGLTSSYQFDSAPPTGNYRGNNTSVLRLLNTGTFACPNGNSGGSNGYLISKKTYFDDGMLDTSADPCGNTTDYEYSLTYWGSLPTAVTNALSQQTTYAFDFNTSLKTSATDLNQLLTSYTYDPLWRLQQTTHPDSSVDTDTSTYQESAFPFTATLTSAMNTGQNSVPLTVFDGLGRVSQTQHTSDPQGTVYADTTYDVLGRVASVSNPYRKGTDATSSPGTTSYTHDALNRKIQETFPDGSVIKTAYCGPSTLVTDPTGRWRRSRTDALGRLVEVDEPTSSTATVNSNGCPGTNDPVLVTSYTYDGLGRLTQVVQNGSHNRTFSYDSLSRLLTSNNPETGTITYTYNPDGTVLTKQDARGITTCYGDWSSATSTCNGSTGYDALHRVLKTTFSNGDPALAFTYDESNCLGLSACHNIGNRTSMTDGAGSEHWAYQVDKTNNRNIHREQRTNNGITKTTTYTLDFQGNVSQIVYPTGRTVNYTYDSANRPSSAADGSSGVKYVADWKTPPANTNCTASAVCYTPQGSVYGMSLGQTSSFTGLNLSETFNSRLQPNEIKASSTAGTAMDITYNFVDPTSNHNAGIVYGITNNKSSVRSQSFTYDHLNRITSAGTSATTGGFCWGYQYNYDAWGNLLSQAGWSPTYNACTESTMSSVTADGNNHISGFSYDSSGNTLGDGNFTYTWDAQSQLKTAGGVTYTYDGDGRRTAKVGSKLYWYGSGGEILAETDTAGNTQNEYVYFGKERVALVPGSGTPLYYAEDFLGSSRVIVQFTGTTCYDGDFTPFGGERAYTNTCPQNYKFEGKERDTETGNDDFGAREYSWRFGRWLSSDWSATPIAVPYANLSNPQTLNLYAMVTDDPESFADLDGHTDEPLGILNLITDIEQTAQATIDKIVQPLVESATAVGGAIETAEQRVVAEAPDAATAGRGVLGESLGIGLGALGFYGAEMINPHTTVGGDKPQTQEGEQHQEKEPAAASGGARKGGGKRGGENSDAALGREKHNEFFEKAKTKGWQTEPRLTDPKTGKQVKPDAVTTTGHPVELKPRTPSGQAAGRQQLNKYERATGKNGRVIYYDKD